MSPGVAGPVGASVWWRTARANPLFRRGVLLALVVVALDQLSKMWVLHGIALPDRPLGRIELSAVFDLTYVENTGVSFGLFAGGTVSRVVLSIVSVVVAAYVVRWLGTLLRRVAAIGAGLIVGGAIGNLYDRVLYGYVVDFLDFSGLGFPFVFNVADAAINVGVACLAYDAFVVAPKAAQEERAPKLTKTEEGTTFPAPAAPGKTSRDPVTKG